MWILESSKQVFNEEEINEIHQKVNDFFNQSYDESNQDFEKKYSVLDAVDMRYGNYLLNYFDNYGGNVKLTRMFLNG